MVLSPNDGINYRKTIEAPSPWSPVRLEFPAFPAGNFVVIHFPRIRRLLTHLSATLHSPRYCSRDLRIVSFHLLSERANLIMWWFTTKSLPFPFWDRASSSRARFATRSPRRSGDRRPGSRKPSLIEPASGRSRLFPEQRGRPVSTLIRGDRKRSAVLFIHTRLAAVGRPFPSFIRTIGSHDFV